MRLKMGACRFTHACAIPEKNACLQLLLVETVLHEIADTDDAFRSLSPITGRLRIRPAVIVASTASTRSGERQLRMGVDIIFGHRRDIEAEHCGTVSGRRVDEVSLRKYLDRFHPPILDYQGAGAIKAEDDVGRHRATD